MGVSILSLDISQKRECCEKKLPLYHALQTWLSQPVSWDHRTHLTTHLWMVVALSQRGAISHNRWLPYPTLPYLSWAAGVELKAAAEPTAVQ